MEKRSKADSEGTLRLRRGHAGRLKPLCFCTLTPIGHFDSSMTAGTSSLRSATRKVASELMSGVLMSAEHWKGLVEWAAFFLSRITSEARASQALTN